MGAGASTIFSVGSNVNGAILRTGLCWALAVSVAITQGTAAPASLHDTANNNVELLSALAANAVSKLERSLLIPAGRGCFAISGGAGTGGFSATYDLL